MGRKRIASAGSVRLAASKIRRITSPQAPPGYVFDVITHGFGAMPDYAAQVPVADRWAIAAYLKALQLSQNATIDDVPADRRGELDKQ